MASGPETHQHAPREETVRPDDCSGEPTVERPAESGPPYSVFTSKQKKLIVFAASLGSVFSPMSTTIYLPALNTLASDLHVSNSEINLTVTTFLIFQGLAPAIVAGFSDSAGRRPAFIYCYIVYIAANIGLALQKSYAALLVLRCLQSAGSSGTIAIAQGVVADVATSAERGIYVGYASVASVMGPILGPIIGGLISQYLGWQWIFWFLAIAAGAYFVPFLLLFPETCRHVVGDGSVPPRKMNMSLLSYIEETRRIRAGEDVDPVQVAEVEKNYHLSFPNPISTLAIVGDKGNALILFLAGLIFACFYAINTGIPSQFGKIYHFDELKIGFVFIPFGAGSIISAFTTGKMIDYNYRRHAKRTGLPLVKNRFQDLTDVSIEKIRVQVSLPLLYLACLGMITYGWVLYFRTTLAGPLVMLFVTGYGIMAAVQVINVLMIDLNPGHAAAATAANNLFRCLLGAGSTAAVVPMINKMGVGWTYTFAALVWVALSPVLLFLAQRGPVWRRAKKDQKDAKEMRKEEKKKKEDLEQEQRAAADGASKRI